MKPKNLLKILNIFGFIFLLKPCAWILWKIEAALTRRPELSIIIIVFGVMALTIAEDRKMLSWPHVYFTVMYIFTSIFWRMVRSALIERVGYLKNPSSYKEENRIQQ